MQMGFASCTWNVASASLDYVSSGIKPGLVSAAALIPGTKMLHCSQLSSLGREVLWLGDGRESMPPETGSTHAYVDIRYFNNLASDQQERKEGGRSERTGMWWLL